MAFNFLLCKRRRWFTASVALIFVCSCIFSTNFRSPSEQDPGIKHISDKHPAAPRSEVLHSKLEVAASDISRFTVPRKAAVEEKGEQRYMMVRLNQTDSYCARLKYEKVDYLRHKNIVISRENNFLHCAVTKAGSTFWTRFVLALNRTAAMASPYSLPLVSTKFADTTKLESVIDKDERWSFVKSAFRSMFVRDPYTRMFSAYVDKVFAPNPTYWDMWGKKAIRHHGRHRGKEWRASRSCGSNVTFAEVISYANDMLYFKDMHFMPAYIYCRPCQLHYDFIGKMETFSQDLELLSRRLNLSIISYLKSSQFRYDYAKDAIEDSINSPFSWMRSVLRCMDKHEMGLRVWRKLQIRGLISRRIPFPYTPESFKDVTAQELIRAALDARSRSTDREELRRQKRDAFVEAYSTVDANSMSRLISNFREDFVLFGYESRPPDVFKAAGNITRGAFDWRNEWVA